MEIPILFEDDSLLVINKPPGVVVQRANSVKSQTVEDWMEEKVPRLKLEGHSDEDKIFQGRAGIVHRIDKETSGCLLLAKTPQAFGELQKQFKDHQVTKTYLAIVHGKLVPEQGEIRAPVGRLPWHRERFGIVPGGKEAVTKYTVGQTWQAIHDERKEEVSLVELYPETGRTHQIRVHLKYMSHPIVGDYLYAGRKVSRADRAWVGRVMLHAWKIAFLHPVTGSQLAMEAPIPDDMKRIMRQ